MIQKEEDALIKAFLEIENIPEYMGDDSVNKGIPNHLDRSDYYDKSYLNLDNMVK